MSITLDTAVDIGTLVALFLSIFSYHQASKGLKESKEQFARDHKLDKFDRIIELNSSIVNIMFLLDKFNIQTTTSINEKWSRSQKREMVIEFMTYYNETCIELFNSLNELELLTKSLLKPETQKPILEYIVICRKLRAYIQSAGRSNQELFYSRNGLECNDVTVDIERINTAIIKESALHPEDVELDVESKINKITQDT